MKPYLSLVVLFASALSAGCASGGGPLKPAAPADASATAVLWRDPGAIGSKDLFWGSGAEARAPQGPFTFVAEDTSGTNPKITVKDARGVEWDMKFDEEVHAEVGGEPYRLGARLLRRGPGTSFGREPSAARQRAHPCRELHRSGRRIQELALPGEKPGHAADRGGMDAPEEPVRRLEGAVRPGDFDDAHQQLGHPGSTKQQDPARHPHGRPHRAPLPGGRSRARLRPDGRRRD